LRGRFEMTMRVPARERTVPHTPPSLLPPDWN
jgi:hypothetical protein